MSVYEGAGARLAREEPVAGARPGLTRAGSRRWQLGLRTTLLTLLIGLLLATVASIGVVQWLTSARSMQEIETRSFRMLALTTNSQVRGFLEPSQRVLEEARTRTQYGRLPVDDTDALATYLVDRLRYEPGLSWLSYSDAATGRFTGAWRDAAGQIVLNQSTPGLNEGRATEAVIHPDGSRTPLQRDLPPGYDPRTQDWYARGRSTDGVVWTEPFAFPEGRRGVTAALAVRSADTDQLRGVFTADVFLDDVSRFLATVLHGHPGRAIVLTRAGEIIARSYVPEAAPGPGLLASGLAAMPVSLAMLPADEPISFTFVHEGARYIVAGQALGVPGGPDWATAYWMPEDQFLDVIYREQQFAAGIALLFLLLAVVLGVLLASRIAGPLHSIAQDLEQVARFNLALAPSRRSFVREIAVVSDSTDRMKASLRSFGRYVPTELVRELLAQGEEAHLGGQTRCLTIHFSDIVNFTNLSEHLPPAQMVENLAEYLQVMTAALEEHQGTIDKFMGDGILAFFNAPNEVPDHAALACRAALRAQERLQALQGKWQAEGRPVFRARIGLHTGDVLVGNIGIPERFAYTVLGDTVNLASRLENLNKIYGTRILASQDVREAAGPQFEWRRLDQVAVAGRSGRTEVNELLGVRGSVPAETLAARDQYEQALEAYFARRFAEAAAGFRAAASLPDNHAAEMMFLRAEAFGAYPPPEDWDGVYVLRSKD